MYVKPSMIYDKERQFCWLKQFLLQTYTTKCYSELKSSASLCFVIWIINVYNYILFTYTVSFESINNDFDENQYEIF